MQLNSSKLDQDDKCFSIPKSFEFFCRYLFIVQSEATCLQRKSVLGKKSTCSWVKSSTYTGSASPEMVCVWRRPTIELLTMIEISMLVNIAAIPVYLIIGHLVNTVLLAPTTEEVMQQLNIVRSRRKSAVLLANSQQQEALVTATNTQARPKLFKTFSSVNQGVLARQQTTRQSMLQTAVFGNLNPVMAEDGSHFDSVDNLMVDLVTHNSMLVGRKREKFLSCWPYNNAQTEAALKEELREVKEAAEEWKEKLKTTPPAVVGIRLLRLFVEDMMGRQSRQARVFVNHLEQQQLEDKLVMSLGVKALAFSMIVLLNLFFIFTCMLYGRSNGRLVFVIS